MFAYVWEFIVKESRADEFLQYYEPDGVWVRFFRRDENFIKTELLHDVANPLRFLTIDYWQSREARDAFRQRYADEFARIDEGCAAFLQAENFQGDFQL